MPIVASSVLTDARVLLNDPSGAIYVDTPMYNLMNKAYRELQRKLSSFGLSATKELSAVIPVTAGTLFLGEGAGLPNDFLYPISLEERAQGTTEKFVGMTEVDLEPTIDQPDVKLTWWAFREEQIKFVGASTNREIKMSYVKSLGTITGAGSAIVITDSDLWIAQRTAALAALVLGANTTRAAALMTDLEREGGVWDDLKLSLIRQQQSIPVRRRRTRYRVP